MTNDPTGADAPDARESLEDLRAKAARFYPAQRMDTNAAPEPAADESVREPHQDSVVDFVTRSVLGIFRRRFPSAPEKTWDALAHYIANPLVVSSDARGRGFHSHHVTSRETLTMRLAGELVNAALGDYERQKQAAPGKHSQRLQDEFPDYDTLVRSVANDLRSIPNHHAMESMTVAYSHCTEWARRTEASRAVQGRG